MHFNSTELVTDASVSLIAESRAPGSQPAPITLVLTVTSRGTKFIPSYRLIIGSKISVRRCEGATVDLLNTIRQPDVRDAPLTPHLYTIWLRHAQIDVT